MKIRYKTMVVNRPVIIRPGWEGDIAVNEINTYIGEWVTFRLPMSDGTEAELRMSLEAALNEGLCTTASDFEPYYEEEEEYN